MLYTNKDIFIVSAPCCLETEPDSLEAIMAGNDAGANGCAIELDMTADGIAVLCGRGSYRLADGTNVSLSECTFEEARGAFQKIITIGQAIELAKSCASKLCIHVRNPGLCAQVQLALVHADYADFAYFVDLNMEQAAKLARRFPTLNFMADVGKAPADEVALIRAAQDAGLFGLRAAPDLLTRSLSEEAHRVGLFLACTECHDTETLQRLIELDVNFIETLRPDIAFGLLPQPEEEDAQLTM